MRCARPESRRTGSSSTPSPVDAVKDALAQLEPPPDRIVVSTHPEEKSGLAAEERCRQDPRGGGRRARRARGRRSRVRKAVPKNVLVVANETVIGEPLLARIRERAQRGPASFLIIAPQSDPTQAAHPEADRRLRRALDDSAARTGSTLTGKSRIPIRSRPRPRPSKTSGSTRSSSRPSAPSKSLVAPPRPRSSGSARRRTCPSSTSCFGGGRGDMTTGAKPSTRRIRP